MYVSAAEYREPDFLFQFLWLFFAAEWAAEGMRLSVHICNERDKREKYHLIEKLNN